MALKEKIGFAVLIAAGGLLVGGSAAAGSLPAWAGSPEPFTEVACWTKSFGRLLYNGAACGVPVVYDDFDIPVPIKTSSGSETITVSWQKGNACGGACIEQMDVKRLLFNADGTLNNASAFNANTGFQSAPSVTVPLGGTVSLWIRAKESFTTTSWVSRVSTSGSASL